MSITICLSENESTLSIAVAATFLHCSILSGVLSGIVYDVLYVARCAVCGIHKQAYTVKDRVFTALWIGQNYLFVRKRIHAFNRGCRNFFALFDTE